MPGPYYTQSGEEYEDPERDALNEREPQPKRAIRTFRYEDVGFGSISASDLIRAIENRTYEDGDIEAYRIEVQGTVEWGQALYYPNSSRLGIAWGADATWATVPNVEDGINVFLNDPERWEQWN